MSDKKNKQDFSMKQVQSLINTEHWEELATLANTTTEKVQAAYSNFINDKSQHLRKKEMKLGDAEFTEDCAKREFELSIFEALGIKGHVELCGSVERWSAKLKVGLVLFGGVIWETDYVLSSTEASVTYNPDLWLVKASLTIGIKGSNLCVYIKGHGCYYAPFKWHCSDEFDETLFCFQSVRPYPNERVRIKNQWKGKYINIETGKIQATDVQPGWLSAQWIFEPVQGKANTYRIKNVWKSSYLHIENGKLECGNIQPGWWSAQWQIQNLNGNLRIRNVWKDNIYINNEHAPEVEATKISDVWESAKWIVQKL